MAPLAKIEAYIWNNLWLLFMAVWIVTIAPVILFLWAVCRAWAKMTEGQVLSEAQEWLLITVERAVFSDGSPTAAPQEVASGLGQHWARPAQAEWDRRYRRCQHCCVWIDRGPHLTCSACCYLPIRA